MNRRQRGAVLVEFAMALPVIIMLLLGTVTGGIAYSHKLNISHAAREAARYGATLPDNQFGAGAGSTWASTVAQVARDRASGDLAATGATICVALVTGTNPVTVWSDPGGGTAYFYSSSGGSAAPCYSDGGTDGNRRVQVKLTYPGQLQAAAFTMSMTLSAQADAHFEF
jgi:Flp pilus assembly protein TadG